MFYTSFLSFWLAFLASPVGPLDAPAPHFSKESSCIERDSTFYQELQSRLAAHLAATTPEKIYLHFDRTLLEPGETLWFCAYVVQAGSLLPSLQSNVVYVEMYDAQGKMIARKEILTFDGVAAGEFDFPPGKAGGQYKIKAYTRWMSNTNALFERDITLQNTVLPNVNLKLNFERKAFGPGDVVIARFNAQSIENKALALQKIKFSAQVGGVECNNGECTTDEQGQAFLRFTLPEKLESADGLLNVRLEYQGQQEAISRPIPIVLKQLDLQFFPESGDAIAGLPCKMAFKALNTMGKPADVEGIVSDSEGRTVASFRSFHDGMGAFDFVPKPGEHYTARLTKPFVSEHRYALPEAKSKGVSLQFMGQDANALTFKILGNYTGELYLVGTQRDQLFYFKTFTYPSNSRVIVVPTDNLPIGIARFTLIAEDETPLAERLVFVGRNRGLNIELKTDKETYLPREAVNMSIQVKDYAGRPVQGNFSLAVTDETQLSYADDKQGNLLASLLLEQDVTGTIEEPNFYFDANEAKSKEALDYLLMTQGWRRFEWQNVLDNPPSQAYVGPERAVIEGHLYRQDGKPSWGGKLTLMPNGPTVTTNEEGFFSFKRVDLSKYQTLRYGKGRYYALSNYIDNLNLRLSNPVTRSGNVQYRYEPSLGSCYLTGNVNDGTDALIGATIKVMKGTQFVRGTVADYEGNYRMQLDPGTYDVEFIYTGAQTNKITNLSVLQNNITILDATLGMSTVMDEVTIIAYKIPLIEQDKMASAQTLTTDQIRNLPTRKVNTIVATTVGAASIDGGDVNIKGSRARSTDYYIDGIRVSGGVPPVQDIEDLNEIRRKGYLTRSPMARQFSRARAFYVPKYQLSEAPEQRKDFRPTIYWNPRLTTDKNGMAKVRFYASDAITNFRATLEGLGSNGEIGRKEQKFFVQKPLSLAVKTPEFVIVGDVLQLQIALTNKSNYPMGGLLSLQAPAHFSPENKKLAQKGLQVMVEPGATQIIPVRYLIGQPKKEDLDLQIQFQADEAVLDGFEAKIRTIDQGFPVQKVASGSTAKNDLEISLLDPVQGSVKMTLTAYPNAMETVLKGLERMLHQPSGCFEQVSSTNYPNLFVLDLLRSTGTIRPEVEAQAMRFLEDGYQRLAGYECKTGGFDWYGRDPGHEGLTAYGVLEFSDMKRVLPLVDPSLIKRSTDWLLSRRDGKGGWLINPNSLHGWQNDAVLAAYITWAVTEAGEGKAFSAEIEHLYQTSAQTEDGYVLALLANTLSAAKDPRAAAVLARLLTKQANDGSWAGQSQSVFHSQGLALNIETTALAVLALIRNKSDKAAIEKGISYLMKSKNEYGFGNTQSTVLALKALTAYAQVASKQVEKGVLVVQIDGKKVSEQPFSSTQLKRLEVKGLEQYITNDHPKVEVFAEGSDKPLSFDIEWNYASRAPQSVPECPLSLQTNFNKTSAQVGETLRLEAGLKNASGSILASPILILGIPAGLSLQPWQLKKLVDEKQCDFYELWNGFIVFHFERMNANESRQISLDLRADIAGSFDAPASQALLYYQNNLRVWSKPARIELWP